MLAVTAASLAAAGVAPALAALVQKKTPYFASISASKGADAHGGRARPIRPAGSISVPICR